MQLVSDRTCVFVWGAADFEVREVEIGATDGEQIEIVQGLQAGERIAAVNAFHLKAEYIKSSGGGLGAHSSCSH